MGFQPQATLKPCYLESEKQGRSIGRTAKTARVHTTTSQKPRTSQKLQKPLTLCLSIFQDLLQSHNLRLQTAKLPWLRRESMAFSEVCWCFLMLSEKRNHSFLQVKMPLRRISTSIISQHTLQLCHRFVRAWQGQKREPLKPHSS